MRPNSVFSIFVDRASRGDTITIQGTGEQARQFTHARDVGRAFDVALTQGAAGRVYNIVADEFITIRKLAELVTSIIPARLEFAPARKADVPTAHVSSARARKELGWEPTVSFDQGLRELVQARAGLTTS